MKLGHVLFFGLRLGAYNDLLDLIQFKQVLPDSLLHEGRPLQYLAVQVNLENLILRAQLLVVVLVLVRGGEVDAERVLGIDLELQVDEVIARLEAAIFLEVDELGEQLDPAVLFGQVDLKLLVGLRLQKE